MPSKQKSGSRQKALLIIAASVLTILVLVVIFILLRPADRSVVAYCEVYQEEKTRLAKLPGDTWPSAVFDEELSDAGEFATAFNRLEKVAPDEIRSDVTTIQSIYQKIHDDPAQAIGASLSGVTAEGNVKEWTQTNCR